MSTSAENSRSTLSLPPLLQAVLLTVAALALLTPGLGAGFIWDDIRQIEDSPTIADPNAPLRYFSLNVVESWGSEGRGGEGVDTYRPMFFVALWSIHHVNGPDPFWYHLAVVVAHLVFCLLLWAASRRWLGSDLAAAGVFAAFAIHPVTAEAYLWASALSEPLSVAGLLGAALILDKWGCSDRIARVAVASGFVMLLGLLSKEAVLTALPVVSLYLWRVRGVRLPALAGPWTAAIVFLALRVHALEGLQATGSGAGQRLDAVRNFPVLVLDGLRGIFTLQPVGVRHLFWDYRDVSWTTSLLAGLAMLTLCVLAWFVRRRTPLVPSALGVLFCMLVPIALITTTPGWSGFGRYLYLPWGFVALGIAEVAGWLRPFLADRAPRLRPALPVLVVIFLAFELIGLHQAFDTYRNQESLARASVELQPHAPDGWEWLGNHYVAAGDLPNAARCYAEAVSIEPSIYRPRHNLATALYHLGRPSEALEHESAVAATHGPTAEVAAVAAASCLELGRRDEAKRWISTGLEIEPDNSRLLELKTRLTTEGLASGD